MTRWPIARFRLSGLMSDQKPHPPSDHSRYDRPVTLGPHVTGCVPRNTARTRVISHCLKVSPANISLTTSKIPYGHWLARLRFPSPLQSFRIESIWSRT